MEKYKRSGKEKLVEEAEIIKDELETLMLIKCLERDAELSVELVDYTWVGHVMVNAQLGDRDQNIIDGFRIKISSGEYELNGILGEVRTRMRKKCGKSIFKVKERESVLQAVKSFII